MTSIYSAAAPSVTGSHHHRLILSVALIASLSACGGGGGTKSTTPVESQPLPGPAPAPAPSPTPAPAPTPAPVLGPPTLSTPVYRGAWDNLRVPTGVAAIKGLNLDGSGSVVGVLDAGYLGAGAHHASAPLDTHYTDFTREQTPDTNAVEKYYHGHYVTSVIAGQAGGKRESWGQFEGGIAPGSTLYWGRICESDNCWTNNAFRALTQWQNDGVALDVLNISLGTARTESNASSIAGAWHSALSPALAMDALVVVSTGNQAQSTPNHPAALPVYYPEWETQLLAVGAISVTREGQPGTLESYSNQCGDAANWCLVAPAYQYVTPMLDDSTSHGWTAGTSIAAPVVSGVAALVKQAYPWMSASNLQQTLLTTATDLGEPGVDPVYGWGAVNASKAVFGPARFTSDFHADVDAGYNSVFANAIDGSGGLIKSGGGSLELRNNNHFSGPLQIDGGTLILTGSVRSDVHTRQGLLQANGGRIEGSYHAGTQATTSIAIGAPLQIGGQAHLDGQLLLRGVVDGYLPATRETLLQASAVNGQFQQVRYGSGLFYSAELHYGSDQVAATLTRTDAPASAEAIGLSAPAIAGVDLAAQALDQLGNDAADDLTPPLLASVIATPLDNADATFTAFGGDALGAGRLLSVVTALSDIADHADQLPLRTRSAAPSVWASTSVRDGQFHRNGQADSPHTQRRHQIGMDLAVGETGLRLGGSIEIQQHSADNLSQGSQRDATAHAVNAYVQQPLGIAYASAQIAYGHGQVETLRWQGGQALYSNHHETMASARVEAGFHAGYGLSPFLAVAALNQRQGRLHEQADNALGLSVDAHTAQLRFAESGLRMHQQRDGWQVSGTVAWRHLLNQPRLDLPAHLSVLPDASTRIPVDHLPSSGWRAALSISAELAPQVTVFGSLGLQHQGIETGKTARVGLRWHF